MQRCSVQLLGLAQILVNLCLFFLIFLIFDFFLYSLILLEACQDVTLEDSLCAVAIWLSLWTLRESLRTCQRDAALEDSLCAVAIWPGLWTLRESLRTCNEMQLWKTRCVRWQSGSVFRL